MSWRFSNVKTTTPEWWTKPRRVWSLTNSRSWVVPYAEETVKAARAAGDDAILCTGYKELGRDGVVFLFSWERIVSPDILALNHRNLVVHASDLPKGRGFSPLAWQIIEGRNEILVCLFEAEEMIDSGPIIYREVLTFENHELIGEMRERLGQLHVDLALRFLSESAPLEGTPQHGEPTNYSRRGLADSRLDPHKTISEQFDLLRVVDNERYPAFFDLRGHRYKLSIEKMSNGDVR